MLNVGEQLVSSYLRYVRKCDFIQTNLPTTKAQGEIDVVGLNTSKRQIYICEVAIHIGGLQYTTKDVKNGIKTTRPDNVQRLTDKFSRGIEYAREHWNQYDYHFMFWSPIVKHTSRKPENNQMRHLEKIRANIKERYCVEIEFIVNERFQECLAELRSYAADETPELRCPLMRLMQIEEYLDKHVKKITRLQRRESTPILTDKSDEEMDDLVSVPVTASTAGFPYTGPEMKALRLKSGLTQGDVAVALGMKRNSSAAIGDWEAERLKVPAKHHVKLLSLYESANT